MGCNNNDNVLCDISIAFHVPLARNFPFKKKGKAKDMIINLVMFLFKLFFFFRCYSIRVYITAQFNFNGNGENTALNS